MELGSLSGVNLYTERAMQDAQSANVEKLRQTARKTAEAETDEELMSACREFESYFLEQVFKEMQKSVEVFKRDPADKSTDSLVSFFKDSTLTEICKTSTETQGLGLAQMMYENMKMHAGVSADSVVSAVVEAEEKAAAENAGAAGAGAAV